MARPPFPSVQDMLQIGTGRFHKGADEENLRDTYYGLDDFTFANTFTPPGGASVTGEWVQDPGDTSYAPNVRETRAFCISGKATLTFTGTALIVRVQRSSAWGHAAVYIDGVKPSTLGLSTGLDVLECNADVVGTPEGYQDVLVAEGLAAGAHTLDLYATNAPEAFFVLSAAKVRSSTLNPSVALKMWHVGAHPAGALNTGQIALKNVSAVGIDDVEVTFSAGLRDAAGNAFASPVVVGAIPGQGAWRTDYTVQDDAADTIVRTIAFKALYRDPAGSVSKSAPVTFLPNNPALTYSANQWFFDNDGPQSVARAVSTVGGATVTFAIVGTTFDITLQKDYGWGKADVKVGATVYATLDCHDEDGGGFAAVQTVSGLPADATVVIAAQSASPFVFTQIAYSAVTKFSEVTETVTLNVTLAHIPPFAPANVRLSQGAITHDAVDRGLIDLSGPRTNEGVVEARLYTRFPSYCVYYQAAKLDRLDDYDLVIIEATAVSRKQVAAWQARGIKVLGYISFGEEDGQYVDIYDLNGEQGPQVDDGLGPGGYASYYNKGGNLFAESSECAHDRQRAEGVKACSLSRAEYFTGTGRCAPTCAHDWRDGYATQSTGGQCGAGFTAANNWQRDAMSACRNTACPSYSPRNDGCPAYQRAENAWGQDFAMDDDYPDQNGIWKSSFANPLAPRWKEKLRDDYGQRVLGAPIVRANEAHTLASHTIARTSETVLVFKADHPVIDDAEPVTVTVKGVELAPNVDYSFDKVTGAFILAPEAGQLQEVTFAAGDAVTLSYTQLGLACDGIFMDTVDTVDVYPSEAFNQGMADLINSLKAHWPTKYFCSNRGFGVLDKIIDSCEYVMFESFLSDYDWDTGQYRKVTDPDTLEFVAEIIAQLQRLRTRHTFDVLALNYCDNGPAGDELRQYLAETALGYGFMNWSSTINLDDPLPNNPLTVNPRGALRTNLWFLMREVRV